MEGGTGHEEKMIGGRENGRKYGWKEATERKEVIG